MCNGYFSLALAPKQKQWALWQKSKHPCRQLREKIEAGKNKSKIAWKVKDEQKLVKNSPKTAGERNRGFTEDSSTTTSRKAGSN